MTSLPGERARSARLVTRPYPTAASAHISATTTPWSDRKSDKEDLSETFRPTRKRRPKTGRRQSGRAVYRALRPRRPGITPNSTRREPVMSAQREAAPRSLPRNPEAAGALRRAGPFRLLRLLAGRGRFRRRLTAGPLGVDHLESRQRVPDRTELLGVALLQQREQRAGAVDRLAHLLPVGRGSLVGRRAEARLAGGEVEQRHRRLDQHVVDGDALHLGLELAQLLL